MIVRHAQVGRYEIDRHLASGGMAEVYLARDTESGEIVALKIPHDGDEIWQAEKSGAALQVELSRLDARVPRVYEIADSEDRFVAMEYVDGEDLSRRIQRGALDWREATRIAIELCGVLTTARSCSVGMNGDTGGIVHGDIKPRNVRIQENGQIKVLDFGIAKALRKARVETRNFFGSVPYSSPERLDRARVDYHSDLWSVAVVLYEMLEGERPFRAAGDDELERLIRSCPRPMPLRREMPLEFEAVLEKALASRIGDRYESSADLEEDLRAVLNGLAPVAEIEKRARDRIDPLLAPWGPDVSPQAAVGGEGGVSEGNVLPRVDEPESDVARAGDATRRTLHEADAAIDDRDATRRTVPGADADFAGATRRTLNGATHSGALESSSAGLDAAATDVGLAGGPDPAIGTASQARAAAGEGARALAREPLTSIFLRRWRRIPWKAAFVLVFVIFAVREFNSLSSAADLRASLPTRPRGDSRTVWNEYRRLTRNHPLVHVSGLGGAVREWFVSHADDLISRYRSDTPSIGDLGWRSAQSLLERASTLDPGNRRIRARLEYCRGHVQRIAARENKQRAPAMAQYDEAVGSFERSAALWPGWPDPYIGLAQVFAYGKKNPDRTAEVLDKARGAGYPFGERESAVLGDAYRLRAERFWAIPTRDFDTDQHYNHLERVRDDCVEALALYETIPAYGDVTRHLRGLRQRLTQVEIAMHRLEGGSPETSQ